MVGLIEQILPMIGMSVPSRSDLVSVDLRVDPRALAQGHLAAAALNAIDGQSEELIRFHCTEAVRNDSEIVDVMRLYIDRGVPRVPDIVCKAYRELRRFEQKFPVVRHLAFGDRGAATNPKRQNTSLMEVLADIAGPTVSKRYDSLLRHELAVGKTAVDLIGASAFGPVFGHLDYGQQSYFKAHLRQSDFRLVYDGNGGDHVLFRLSSRIRNKSAVGKVVSVLINGVATHTWEAEWDWSRSEFMAGPDALKDGINRLTIMWPDAGTSKEDQLEYVCHCLERAVDFTDFPDVYVIYGELYEFTARIAS
jgi:hypothetical protein